MVDNGENGGQLPELRIDEAQMQAIERFAGGLTVPTLIDQLEV